MSISNRVRLYELSRELDLDTKDVISMCEQLNIVVKSHSSTITESEAELVRTKAPQHHPKPADPKASEKKVAAAAKTKEADARTAKQQILAVTKPTIRLTSPPVSVNVGSTPPLDPPINPPPNPISPIDEPSSESPTKTAVVTNHLSPMPLASSLVKPPSRPSTPEGGNSKPEITPASKIELTSETPLTPPVISQAIKPSPSAPQPELIAPPMPPSAIAKNSDKTSDKTTVAVSKKSPVSATANIPANIPASVATNIVATPPKEQPPRKETPRVERPQPERAERPLAPKQALMSVSPPPVKVAIAKPVAPERPKPPVAIAPKALIVPKPPAARPSDESRISAKAAQSKSEQNRFDQNNIDLNGGNDFGDEVDQEVTATAKPEIAKANKPERPKLNKPAEPPAAPAAPAAPAGGRPQSRGPKLVKDSVMIERGITAPTEPPHNLRPPMPTLMRAPEKPVIADKTSKKPDAAGGFNPALPELLEKPTLPGKGSKRKGKSKEEEEKDLQQNSLQKQFTRASL